jgi:hypothetical protein
MPTNVWRHHLFMTDLVNALANGEDFQPVRNQMVHRIRSAQFYRHDNIVLRNLVDDLATAGSIEQANQDWTLVTLWADQPDNRVWIETTFPLDEFNDHQDRHFQSGFTPPLETVTALVRRLDLPDAMYQPILLDALAEWCELTATDPADLGTDQDARAVLACLDDAFYDRRARCTAEAFTQNLQRAALVVLGGAHLAQLRGTPVVPATLRVARAVTDQLGTPTGYEGQPDLLAREIHHGAPWARM